MLTAPSYSTTGISLIQPGAHPTATECTVATVMAAELRGYATLAERLSPLQLLAVLGELFGLFKSAVLQHGGQVFRLSETGMIAAFGVCDSCHTHSDDAILAANAFRERYAAAAGSAWQQAFAVNYGVGIGVHRGEVAIGFFDGGMGKDFPTLVGDTVNVAAHLCARSRCGEVLISGVVKSPWRDGGSCAIAPGSLPPLHLPDLRLQQRSTTMDVWCLPLARRNPKPP